MGNLGPMSRQNSHFSNPAVEKLPYAMDRYRNEVNRLYGVLNTRLADRPYIAGDYSIADMASLSVRDAARAPAPEDRRLRTREALARRHQGASGGRARLCMGP
jgi:glutathione S-transferase